MVKFSQCVECKNYIGTKDGKETCKAFDNIPNDVFWGDTEHDKPINGDHGIVFESVFK